MPRLVRAPRLLTVPLALLLVVSCDNPICGCVTPARAVVYGRVTNPAGAGVANSFVRTAQVFESCDAAAAHDGIGFAYAEADGRYRIEMRTVAPPSPSACLRAWADAPALTSWRGSDTATFAVEMRHEGRLDSVRVDLVLRAP